MKPTRVPFDAHLALISEVNSKVRRIVSAGRRWVSTTTISERKLADLRDFEYGALRDAAPGGDWNTW